MNKHILFSAALASLIFVGCREGHLISDAEYLWKVRHDFNERKELARNRSEILFSVMDQHSSSQMEEALEFLFAYMPLSDLADYPGSYFSSHAEMALKTREQMTWGKKIPWDIFMHFVLPPRVNNENLDSFRLKYYDEIAGRIRGLDAEKAALEINHWCHEKVAYQPSDIRTSGPESTILSARGRCGEESTFTVAALRAAGIPARQVYTPRWAHSDDNHAWVEVWIAGKWYYMGACEPEPVLDRGWFTEPARRAMLVHTRSFGAPSGGEQTINEFRNYSLVNNLSKYAQVKTIFVKVTGSSGQPVTGATVEYCLYNYSEFFPLAAVPSDSSGISSFETGLGDLMIWAFKNNDSGFRKISVSETDTLVLELGTEPPAEKEIHLDLGVPVTRAPFPGPPEDLVKANSERVALGNSIREKYRSTWMTPSEAVKLALESGADTSDVKEIIKRSEGNYREISAFIRDASEGTTDLAVKLLKLVSDKDLRDTRSDVLSDHLLNMEPYKNSTQAIPEDVFYNYVLNPRIANEILSPWRGYLKDNLPQPLLLQAASDPERLVSYTDSRVTINEADNYYKTPITPVGVNELRVADDLSRDIYFVALCRSTGIPARLEEGTGRPQYFRDGSWVDVYFAGQTRIAGEKGYVKLQNGTDGIVPEYYIHFTLARFENGKYNTLGYGYNRKITDFREELSLPPGKYMLVTGNRLSDSRILSSLMFFNLKEEEHKTITVRLRNDTDPPEILGKVNNEILIPAGNETSRSLRELSEKGIVMAWIEPDREPTRHILNDLPLLKKEFDSWGGWFVFFYDPDGTVKNFTPGEITGLPRNTLFVADRGSGILMSVCGENGCRHTVLPLVMLADREGNILYRSEGYRIGIGEQILKTLLSTDVHI